VLVSHYKPSRIKLGSGGDSIKLAGSHGFISNMLFGRF